MAIRMPAAAPPTEVYVSFSAEIMPQSTEALIALLAQQAVLGVPKVTLLLSTPGGSVMNGLNLYNVLRGFPFHLVTHNVGNVDSIGNAVFLAGAERYACPHSTFMFHGVGFDAIPGTRFEEKMARERLNGIVADQKRIASVIQQHTSLGANAVRALFREMRTKDAAYAVSCGIVNEIRDVNVPAGVPVYGLVFQR
jgi:ATP-dependent Clp protease, protease subunit